MSLSDVIATLRFLGDDWLPPSSAMIVSEYADELETHGPDRRGCCPVCQEVECDDNCPVRPYRQQPIR